MDMGFHLNSSNLLSLNWSLEKDLTYIEELINYRFPKFKGLCLDNLPEDSRIIKEFLSYSMGDMKEIRLNYFNKHNLRISNYIPSISKGMYYISQEVKFHNFTILKEDLVEIFSAWVHLKSKIFFWKCKIVWMNPPDFKDSVKNPQFESLSFNNWSFLRDYLEYSKYFHNFLEGLAKIKGIHENWGELEVEKSSIKKKDLEETLDNFRFKRVKVQSFSEIKVNIYGEEIGNTLLT